MRDLCVAWTRMLHTSVFNPNQFQRIRTQGSEMMQKGVQNSETDTKTLKSLRKIGGLQIYWPSCTVQQFLELIQYKTNWGQVEICRASRLNSVNLCTHDDL